jgi:2-hydroxychromene-2-carboxylate isomerase
MSLTVDYYFAPQSPWSYLGHQRFWDIARAHGARIRVLPVDLGGKVFPVSGGLPLAKRAPQRQAYRLVELRRFSTWLGAPLNLEPKHFRSTATMRRASSSRSTWPMASRPRCGWHCM